VEQLYSFLDNFKHIHSKLGNVQTTKTSLKFGYNWKHLCEFQQPHSKLGKIGTIWVNYKGFIQICKYYKHLGKFRQARSKLGQLKQWCVLILWSFHVPSLFHAVKFPRLCLLLLCFNGRQYVVKAPVNCFFKIM